MFHALDASVSPLYYVSLEGRQVEHTPMVRRLPKDTSYNLERWSNTPLWLTVDKVVADLVRDGGLIEVTHHEFIVERICDAVKRREKAIASQLNS